MSAKVKNEDHEEGIPHPLVTLSKIDPDEIPDVPSNRFLYRGEQKKAEDKDGKKSKSRAEEEDRIREKKRAQIRGRTKSGRKIKGRGLLVSGNYQNLSS